MDEGADEAMGSRGYITKVNVPVKRKGRDRESEKQYQN